MGPEKIFLIVVIGLRRILSPNTQNGRPVLSGPGGRSLPPAEAIPASLSVVTA